MFPISWAIKSTSASKIFLYWHKSGDKSLHRLYQIIKETTKTSINSIRRNNTINKQFNDIDLN